MLTCSQHRPAPRLSVPLLVLLVALVTGMQMAVGAASQDDIAAAPRPISELVDAIEEGGQKVSPALYVELASHKNGRALGELKKCERLVDSAWLRQRLYSSLRSFKEDPKLCESAAKWLAERCRSDDATMRQSAARAMAQLGAHAAGHAERLCRRSEHRWVGSLVALCVLDRLELDGSRKDFTAVMEHYVVDVSGSRERLLEVLRQYTSDRHKKLYREALEGREGDFRTKEALVDLLIEVRNDDTLAYLAERMGNPDQVPSVHIIRRLGELDYRGHMDALEELAGSDDPRVAAVAFVGRIRLGEDADAWIARLHGLMTSEDVSQRFVAVEGSKGLLELDPEGPGSEGSRAVIAAGLGDAQASIRGQATDAIQTLRLPALVPAVIDRLDTEDLKERARIEEALELLTGVEFGGSAQRWTAWWENEGHALPLPSLDVATERRKERARRKNKARRTTFYGMNISGNGVCFVLDASGSMGAENYWGESRLEIAKQETVGALERMKDGTTFNIVFFGTTLNPWKERLVVMDAETRTAAIEFVKAQAFLGGTAIYDAIESVFEDEGVENMYVLSDGEPSGGTVNDPEEILEVVKRWNRKRRLSIHCISIGYRSQFLERMAAENNGRFREAE